MIDLDNLDGLDDSIPLDLAGDETGYVVVDPQGNHIRLSPGAYHLLRAVRSGIDFEHLAERLSGGDQKISATELETSYRDVCRRIASVAAHRDGGRLPPGFWLRLPLIGETATAWIARRLAVLFRSPVAPVVLAAIVAALGLAWPGTPTLSWEAGAFWGGYALFVLSLLAHELGHSSACARYGVRPQDIGFTVYLVYPAFYSDVTRAWRLSRGRRVVVDFGGIYFQLIVAAGFALLYRAGAGPVFAAAFWMIILSVLFALNPIFRFDGYWVLADALGVPDLGRQPLRLTRRLFRRLRGRPVETLSWPRWVTAVLVLYTPLSFAVWLVFILRLGPEIGARAAGYPALVLAVAAPLVRGQAPTGPTLHSLLSSTFLLLIAAVMAGRLLSLLRSAIRNRLSGPPLLRSPDAGGSKASVASPPN